MAAATIPAVAASKQLSETKLGGGGSALDAMLGQGTTGGQ
jgi:hypothetical protein